MTENTAKSPHKSSDWMERLSRHRTGLVALSFAESTVVPIPLEAVVVPLMVGHPKRALRIALFIWLGCVLGAGLFYFAGLWLLDPVVMPTLEALRLAQDFDRITDRLGQEGLFWTVFLISLLPAPMQLATLGAGAAQGNFAVFLVAIALSRGMRYFGLTILAQFVGKRIAHLGIPKRYLIPALMLVLLSIWGVLQLL